jgi:hypothetical protein
MMCSCVVNKYEESKRERERDKPNERNTNKEVKFIVDHLEDDRVL